MNIFYVHEDPIAAAQALCNKHVVKMIGETANMLLWKFQKQGGFTRPISKSGQPLQLSHENHPATRWVLQSSENYDWTISHLQGLTQEYQKRYRQAHFGARYLDYIQLFRQSLSFDSSSATPFVGCFGEYNYLSQDKSLSTVEAYRKFYWLDKYSFARWPSVYAIPNWWTGGKQSTWVDASFRNGIYTKR